jgi:hypothetical protein
MSALKVYGRQGLAGSAWLLVLTLVYFGPALWQGRILAPGDGIAQNTPTRVLIGEAWRRGEWPFWNPFNFAGMPLFATLHPGVLFPGNGAYLFLPLVAATDLTVMLAFWLAGVATYLFARAVDLPQPSAILAGVIYAFGGFMACRVGPIQMAQVAALVPVGLWAVERLAQSGLRRYALAFWAALTLQIFAGHPQVMIFGALVTGPYALLRLPDVQAKGRYLGALALAAVLALGTGLVLLLPGLDLIAESQRQAPDFTRLVEGSIAPRMLPTLLFPLLYGNAPARWFDVPYWGPGFSMFGYYGYVGLAPLLLAGCALLGPGRQGPQALPIRFWGVVAALALALAMGAYTPLYRLWAALPVLNQLAGPNRHFMEFDFALAMLAAYGLASLLKPASERHALSLAALTLLGALALGVVLVVLWGPTFASHAQSVMPAGVDLHYALSPWRPAFWLPLLVGAAAVGLAVLTVRRPGVGAAGLVVLTFCDLGLFGHLCGWRQFSPQTPLEISRADYRADGRALSIAAVPYPYFGDGRTLTALGMPGLAALAGQSSVNGYDAFILARYQHILGFSSLGDALSLPALWTPGHHALDLLGMRWLRLAPSVAASPEWQARLASPRWRRLAARGNAGSGRPGPAGGENLVVSVENLQALPRAWRVNTVVAASVAEVDRRVTRDPAFNPRTVALVDKPESGLTGLGDGKAQATTTSLNNITIETDAATPGFVVVSEGYDPGWRAFGANGSETAVHRVDGILLGVAVLAGHQRLQLQYEPPRFRQGLKASLVSLLLVLGWALWPRRGRLA